MHRRPVTGSPSVEPAPSETTSRGLGRSGAPQRTQARGNGTVGERGGPDGPQQAGEHDRLADPARLSGVLDATDEIPNQDVIYEQLATAGVQGGLDPARLRFWGYREDRVLEDARTDFRAVLYVPVPGTMDPGSPLGRSMGRLHQAPLRPVLAIRGAAVVQGRSAAHDPEGVASFQFAANQTRILAVMGGAGVRVDVVGRGTGGAVAQLAACRCPRAVGRVVTFQTTAVDQADAAALRAWNAGSAAGREVSSTHHKLDSDPAPETGEALTGGVLYRFDAAGPAHGTLPLAQLAAARGGTVPGLAGAGGQPVRDQLLQVACGPTNAGAGRNASPDQDSGAERPLPGGPPQPVWQEIVDLASNSALGFQQLLAMIRDEPALRTEDKVALQIVVRQRVQQR